VLALTVGLNPRYLYASHPFLRSSGLTLSGHEPPKTSLILLNMGRTRPRDPLLAGKSRFFGVSSAGPLLVLCVPINLDKSSLSLQVHSTATIDTVHPRQVVIGLGCPPINFAYKMPAVLCFIFSGLLSIPD
jgi:hypothetical protein